MAKNSTDMLVLFKIRKYTHHLKRVYDVIIDISIEDLEDEPLAYSAAQLISNLAKSYDMLKSEDLQDRYKLLRQPDVVKIRDVASNDYGVLNWDIVKAGCRRIVETYGCDEYHDASLTLLEKLPSSLSRKN